MNRQEFKLTKDGIEYITFKVDGRLIGRTDWDDYIGCGNSYWTFDQDLNPKHIGTTSFSYFGSLDAWKTEEQTIRKMLAGTYKFRRVYDLG